MPKPVACGCVSANCCWLRHVIICEMQNHPGSAPEDAELCRYYLPLLPARRDASLLDFGSGLGRVTDFLLSRGYTGVVAFEREEALRPKLSERARAVTVFGSDGAGFLRGAGKTWDAVILREMLYYFNDNGALEFLRDLSAMMAPGGVLLVQVFNGSCFTAPFITHKDHGIQRLFTEHSIVSLLDASGFEVQEMRGLKPEVTGLRSLAFYFGSRVWQWLLRGIYWAERGSDSQNPKILEKRILIRARVAAKKSTV